MHSLQENMGDTQKWHSGTFFSSVSLSRQIFWGVDTTFTVLLAIVRLCQHCLALWLTQFACTGHVNKQPSLSQSDGGWSGQRGWWWLGQWWRLGEPGWCPSRQGEWCSLLHLGLLHITIKHAHVCVYTHTSTHTHTHTDLTFICVSAVWNPLYESEWFIQTLLWEENNKYTLSRVASYDLVCLKCIVESHENMAGCTGFLFGILCMWPHSVYVTSFCVRGIMKVGMCR